MTALIPQWPQALREYGTNWHLVLLSPVFRCCCSSVTQCPAAQTLTSLLPNVCYLLFPTNNEVELNWLFVQHMFNSAPCWKRPLFLWGLTLGFEPPHNSRTNLSTRVHFPVLWQVIRSAWWWVTVQEQRRSMSGFSAVCRSTEEMLTPSEKQWNTALTVASRPWSPLSSLNLGPCRF